MRFIIDALNVKEDDVCFATYTGKAAQVLAKKGNRNVSTLDKLLYDSIPISDGTFLKKPKLDIGYKIVVVDEVSMAPNTLIQLLFRHNVHVICLGDPFQLPAIYKDEDNHLLDHPNIFLDKIMRQAEESEIIRLSFKIRKMEEISFYNGDEVKILPKKELSTGMLLWADQILVGTNTTRININNKIRELLGRRDIPEEGDKVICLRNYWDYIADNGDSLINGTIGYISKPNIISTALPYYLGGKKISILETNFISDSNANFGFLPLDNQMILTGQKCIDRKTEFKIKKSKIFSCIVPMEFTYGYAITGHKSQGSEYPKILCIEEKFPFDKIEHARWLYTVVTRASEKCVLLKN